MNEKCRLCGSYQFNLHQESIDQGELCDVHYWKVLALKGRDVVKFINEHLLELKSYEEAKKSKASNFVLDHFQVRAAETLKILEAAIDNFSSHSHTI